MFLVFLLLAFTVASQDATSCSDEKETKLAHAINDLTFELMKLFKDDKNVFISPFSIATALATAYLGSAGNTTKIMKDVLKYDEYGMTGNEIHDAFQSFLGRLRNQIDGYELSSSNNVFVQKDLEIRRVYKRKLTRYYSADIESVDFSEGSQLQRQINSIVENATRGKIIDFLEQPPSSDAKLFLLNAVYFIGNWLNPFDPEATITRPFYNNGVVLKQVATMFRDGHYKVSRSEELAAEMIILPYKGSNSASMVIVLPEQRTGVSGLEERLDKSAFDQLVDGAREQRVFLILPKFNLTYSADLKTALTSLGLEELFTNSANFTRMVDQNLKVSSVKHKSVIEIDEVGSRAASATGLEFRLLSLPPRFHVDHPCLFYIRDDKTGLILFSGRLDEL